MKRWLCVLVCAGLLLTTGCTYAMEHAAEQEGYALYFTVGKLDAAAGGDAVRTERVTVENDSIMTTRQLSAALLTDLLAGPKSDALSPPIPTGTQLLSVTVDHGHAQVDLSAQYGMLSGVSLTLADYCIAMTLCQLPEVETVSITVRGQELAYRDTQNFSAADVLLSSMEDVVGTVEVSLFFLNGEGLLAPEQRTLELYEGDTQVESLLEALEAGPEGKALTSALPEGFIPQSAWLEENLCYVNLSAQDLQNLPEGADLRTALKALAESLCSLDAVQEVQFLVDGGFTGSYGGVEIGQPWYSSPAAGRGD